MTGDLQEENSLKRNEKFIQVCYSFGRVSILRPKRALLAHSVKFIPMLLFGTIFLNGLFSVAQETQGYFPTPQIPFSPKHYICYQAKSLVVVDGNLDEEPWRSAQWTDYFVDIQGGLKPAPLYTTRVKMLWDDRYLYIGAEIQEPNLWATLREKDTVIYRDNDFEVFIDPNGSTQPYYETEINALGTVWDLLLRLPYRDGEKVAVNAWDIQGLKVAVGLHGTLNDPDDVDSGWTVELAFPWSVLGQCALQGAPPHDGTQWRVNFSRVEWHTEVQDGRYVKQTDRNTGRDLPEENWVWSPQGLIDMHYPEMWGFVQFTDQTVGRNDVNFNWNKLEDVKWVLRRIFYSERIYYNEHHGFTNDLSKLSLSGIDSSTMSWPPKIYVTPDLFEATLKQGASTVHIRQDGKTWVTGPE